MASKPSIYSYTRSRIQLCARYRPEDTPHAVISRDLRRLREQLGSGEQLAPQLIELFSRHLTKFKPVMRHYFTERHKSPISWFRMRLSYARSVATTSIVGHVIGLGDRHLSNILMDEKLGEVVHIDLGIAFEQVRH